MTDTATVHELIGVLNGGQPADGLPTHTWQPQSVVELAARPAEPPTIGGLLYPGKRTLLSGETESLKTWTALILAKAEMAIGLPVAWVDLDAMGPGDILARLQALGVPDEQTHELFAYYEPYDRLVEDVLKELCDRISTLGIRLLVIDAFNPMLTLHGLDPNKTTDIESFWRDVADPLSRAGAAPTVLDHVAKNAETRGKYSYGSERKASGSIVHIGFRGLDTLTRGGTGRSLLIRQKDRPGFLPKPNIGRIVLEAEGTNINYRLEPDHAHDTGAFRPTVLMEKVSMKLETCDDPVTTKWIEENVQGKTTALRTAVQLLVDEGNLLRQDGPRNASLYTSDRPYRQADDTPDSPRPTTSSHLVPNLVSVANAFTSSQSPSPLRGGDEVEADDIGRPQKRDDLVPASESDIVLE